MRRSKFVSGRSVLCEGLESRNLFSNAVGIDASFKAVGYAQPTFRTGADEYANGVIVAKDGRIVVSGTSELVTNGQYDDRVVVAVFNKDGSGSTKFNGNGKLILSAADSAKLGGSAAVIGQASDGGFYLEGGYGVVLKLNANGTIATGYGRAGYVSGIAGYNETNFGNTLVLSDGSIEEGSGSGSSGSSNSSCKPSGPAKGGSGSGVVYVDPDPATQVDDTLQTTQAQDEAIKKYLENLVDNRGSYSILFYNCRSFSRQQFDYISGHLGDLNNGNQPDPSMPRQP